MKRLNSININTPQLSDWIFHRKWQGGVHTKDDRRFDQLCKKFEGGNYLDIGCFNSPKPRELSLDGSNEVHAIDHAPGVVAKMQLLAPKVKYVVGDCYHLPYQPEYFDYVVAGEILEHLESPQSFLAEAVRVLKIGGCLALSTPYLEGELQPLMTEEHLWSFNQEDIKGLLSPYGSVTIEFFRDNWTIMVCFLTKGVV